MNAPKCAGQKPNGKVSPTRNDGQSYRKLNAVSARKIGAAAIHLLAAWRAGNVDQAKVALSAMLDEGVILPEVVEICSGEVSLVELWTVRVL